MPVIPVPDQANNTVADATINRFSIRAVMVSSSRGTAAGAALASGTAGPDATFVFAALALMIVFVGRKIRK